MSNRERVMNLIVKLPEDMPLEEIALEIQLLAGIQTAREQARRGEGTPVAAARNLIEEWVSQSS